MADLLGQQIATTYNGTFCDKIKNFKPIDTSQVVPWIGMEIPDQLLYSDELAVREKWRAEEFERQLDDLF